LEWDKSAYRSLGRGSPIARKLEAYRIDLTEMELSGAPESHKDFHWGGREIEAHGPYWGIAERW